MNRGLLLHLVWFLAGSLLCLPALAQQRRPVTLREAVRLALERNPDAMLARVQEEQAVQEIARAKAPFFPQIVAGSGLAYTEGIPQSVEGANPSIVQAEARQFIYNRSQNKRVQQSKQEAAAAGFGAAATRERMAYRVAAAYLDFERAWRQRELVRDRVENWKRIAAVVAARVEEGREIPLEAKRARLEAAKAKQQLRLVASDAELLEAELRSELGLEDSVHLEPAPTNTVAALALPESEQAARRSAVANSPELKRLDAELRAKEFAVEAERGELFPRIDLVAKYSLLSRFNNFEDFFNTFQRNNGQIGMSFRIPVFAGKRVSSRVGEAKLEARETRIRQAATRSNVDVEAKRLFHRVHTTEGAAKVARLELDFARENLTVVLARFDEGRATLEDVERARAQENAAWSGYYDSRYTLAKAKLNLLRRTGDLLAALR